MLSNPSYTLSFCLLFLVAIDAAEKPSLRVGYAQKPGEARAELDAIRESTPDLESWKKRRDRKSVV